jgi:hypothetical protein
VHVRQGLAAGSLSLGGKICYDEHKVSLQEGSIAASLIAARCAVPAMAGCGLN